MVTDPTRALIWKSLLTAEARCMFFGHIASGRQRIGRILALTVGVLSSGAFLAMIAKWNVKNLAELLSAASATFGIVLTVFSFGKSATLAASIHRKWGEIACAFEGLFHELPRLEEGPALEQWKAIEARHHEIDETASLEFTRRKLLFLKCQTLVEKGRGLGRFSSHSS